MPIYPPPAPTLTGDVLTINRFLNDPTSVQRRLRELSDLRFISDVLLSGRYEIEGGALSYEVSESIFAEDDPTAVSPGGTYPRTKVGEPAAAMASPTNWGEETVVTDAAIKRRKMNPVERSLKKIANTVIKRVDTVSLAAISAAVTQGVNEQAAWSNAAAYPFRDAMLAKAEITTLDEGYDPDILVMDDNSYALMVSNEKVVAGLARESGNTVTSEGEVLVIAGLKLLQTSRLPSGVTRMVLDSTQLGGLGYENLDSPEFTGSSADGVESRVRRDPSGADQWLLAGRRSVVPIVQEPGAACEIGTGF
ncbi:hypothetical protein [Nocardioides sp.]|uniref:phage major capsid protein n=1 Tax=Nocardioides sp. TaxID=35761 RepID=UPI003563AA8D